PRTCGWLIVSLDEWIVFHQSLDEAQVFGRVHRMSVRLCQRQPHATAMLKHTQHVNRLCSFERSWREARKLAQVLAPKRNHAHLLEHRRTLHLCEIYCGNGGAREVEGISVNIHHDLDGVAINILLPFDNSACQIYTRDC